MVLLFLYFIESLSNDSSKHIDSILKDISDSFTKLSKLYFNNFDNTPENDVDIIIEGIDAERKKSDNFFSNIISGKKDDFLDEDCQNCIKINAQHANITFRAMQKSKANKIVLNRLSKNLQCSISHARFTFYNNDKLVHQTPFYKLEDYNSKDFIYFDNVIFDKMKLEAKSNNKNLLCLDEITLQS